MTVKTNTYPRLNSPALTICPLARLSCHRLATAILRNMNDDAPSRLVMNPQTQSPPDTITSTFSNVDDGGRQEVPATSSSDAIFRQLFKVAKCCPAVESKVSREDLTKLECTTFFEVSDSRFV